MEEPPGIQTRKEPLPFLNCTKNCPCDVRESEQQAMTIFTRNTSIPPLTITTPLIEEGLVRDQQANEVYLPLTSTVVLQRKQEMLDLPLDFKNNLTVDDLADSEAYVNAIAQNDLDTKKKQ